MSINAVGYKLIKVEDNTVIETWGGTWGQCPGVPNPIILPNGDQICAPQVDVEYTGYKLILWEMDAPPPKPELTIEEKLAVVGLTLDDLKTALGIK